MCHFCNFGLEVGDSNLVDPFSNVRELDDLVDPAVHSKSEDRLGRDALVPVHHFTLHESVTFEHFPHEIYIFVCQRPNVERLQVRQEILLAKLGFYLRPCVTKMGFIVPVALYILTGECVPEDHHSEDWLNNHFWWFNQVAKISELLKWWLRFRAVFYYFCQLLVDIDFMFAKFVVLLLIFVAKSMRDGDQNVIDCSLQILASNVKANKASFVEFPRYTATPECLFFGQILENIGQDPLRHRKDLQLSQVSALLLYHHLILFMI